MFCPGRSVALRRLTATGSSSLQEAVFGVLYTLSKERLTEGWRFVVFAMVLDYLQVGTLCAVRAGCERP